MPLTLSTSAATADESTDPPRPRHWGPVLAALATAIAVTVSGCTYASENGGAAGGAASASSDTIGADGAAAVAALKPGKAASLVPAAVKAKGTLVAASDASYAPFEYFAPDNTTVVGFAVDLESDWGSMVLAEVDYALRPNVHERRVPSVGSIIDPTRRRAPGRPAPSSP